MIRSLHAALSWGSRQGRRSKERLAIFPNLINKSPVPAEWSRTIITPTFRPLCPRSVSTCGGQRPCRITLYVLNCFDAEHNTLKMIIHDSLLTSSSRKQARAFSDPWGTLSPCSRAAILSAVLLRWHDERWCSRFLVWCRGPEMVRRDGGRCPVPYAQPVYRSLPRAEHVGDFVDHNLVSCNCI